MNEKNTLAAFTFQPDGGEGVTIRAVQIDGNPWFVAADVCRALGMDATKGTYRWLRTIPRADTWLTTYGTFAPQQACGSKGRGGTRTTTQVTLVSEPGLYRLIMRSDKPQASAFQDWVTREVLPAIRKDGAYVMGEEKVRTGEMSEDELVLKALETMQRKVSRLVEERDAARCRGASGGLGEVGNLLSGS